jgi:ribosomal-protein-alanine N-acetyltransferase
MLIFVKNPFLVGPTLYLRPLERADAALLTRWFNDPAVKRSLWIHRPLTLEHEEASIEKLTSDVNTLMLGIARQDDDRMIGMTGLQQIDFKDRNAELAIVIGEAEEWGRGLGTEATRLVVGHAFGTMNLHRIWLQVFEDNARAIGAYEKVGFRREGLLRQALFREGRYWDVAMMGILREELLKPA